MAIASYFLEGMPEHTEIDAIERWEHGPLFSAYGEYRDDLLQELGVPLKTPAKAHSARESIEAWLFFGTRAVDNVLTDGFPATDLNNHDGKFGLGVYFARDPRLPHFVLQREGAHRQGTFQLILARVAVGHCFRQTALRKPGDVVKDKHCRPPPDHHSCTLNRAPGCEVIVFPGLGGTPAYPAYVVTYRTRLQLRVDPYEELALLRVGLAKSKVLWSHPFKQYKKQRPQWHSSGIPTATNAPPRILRSLPLEDWRAANGGGGEAPPAGAPIAAVRARQLEYDPRSLDLDVEMTTTLLPQQAESQGQQPYRSQSPSLAQQEVALGQAPAGRPMSGGQRSQSALALSPLRSPNSGSLPQLDAPRPSSADGRNACSFRSHSTGTARSFRPECLDDLSKALSTYSAGVAIEVGNLPDLSDTGVAPEVYVSEILNPKLRLLRDFDGSQGEAIRSAWSGDGGTVLLEMQSKWLVASTARILDDLPLFGTKLQVRIVPLEEAEEDMPEVPPSPTLPLEDNA